MILATALVLASLLQTPSQTITVQRRPDSVVVVSVPEDPEAHSLAVWTKVLGIATLILAGASVGSLWLLRGQGKDLKAQHVTLQEQSGHLAEQAVQLKASVETAKETAQVELRAYLDVSIGDPSGSHPGQWTDSTSRLTLHLKNNGKTPARYVTTRFEYVFRPFNTEIRDTFIHEPQDSRGTLGAGDSLDVRLTGPTINAETMPLLEYDSGHAMFAYGFIRYFDVFGTEHTTAFFRKLNWRNGNLMVTTPHVGNDFT